MVIKMSDETIMADMERLLRKKGYKQGKMKLYVWWKQVEIDGETYRIFQDLKQMACYMYKLDHQGPSCDPPDDAKALMDHLKAMKDVKQVRLF